MHSAHYLPWNDLSEFVTLKDDNVHIAVSNCLSSHAKEMKHRLIPSAFLEIIRETFFLAF